MKRNHRLAKGITDWLANLTLSCFCCNLVLDGLQKEKKSKEISNKWYKQWKKAFSTDEPAGAINKIIEFLF